MSEWAARRFYKDATVQEEDGGFTVRLDGRPIRTPGKRALVMPSEAMARHVADEWMAQDKLIDPRTMPWTRSVNSALDKVATQRSEVEDYLVAYAGTDLLCYRAERPEGLIERQARAWDPVLEWVTRRYDVALHVTSGVMPVAQDDDTLPRLKRTMQAMTEFHLTGFHDLVTLTGSFALGLAAAEQLQPAEELWKISRIDEDWQAEEWGWDEEAAEAAELKLGAFLHADAFFRSA